MCMKLLKTDLQIARAKRDKAICSEYEQMMRVPGQSATAVAKYLMRKHHINTSATLYYIRKRGEKLLQQEAKQ